ncbi:hypothetical protein D3C72_182340 [compost metagenome]
MQKTLFAGLLSVALTVGTSFPAFAADQPFHLAQTRSQTAQAGAMDSDTREVRSLLAGVSSVILPGFGQWVFNHERPKAVMHFLGAVALWAIPSFISIPSPLDRLYVAIPTLFHLYSGYDAYHVAGGKMLIVAQPGLAAWSFDAEVAQFGQDQALGHLALASTALSY